MGFSRNEQYNDILVRYVLSRGTDKSHPFKIWSSFLQCAPVDALPGSYDQYLKYTG